MDAPIKDINHLLHDLRSAHLRHLPKISGVMLSAGCAGTWYFDWIAKQTGFSGRHIGIEYYTPKPDDLPANVEWIENTVGNMSAVEDASCELVFSGQNLEHLWPEEVIGFFRESARVLKPDGWLVIDSPNRLITKPLGWSHPEHTVELTPAEACKLTELSGFTVVNVVGMWLCRDPNTGRILPFDPFVGDPEWSVVERVLEAESNPDDSFLWWVVGRKTSDADVEGLSSAMNSIFEEAWPERQRRFVYGAGKRSDQDGTSVVTAERDVHGPLAYGPYMPLKAGSYNVTWKVNVQNAANPKAQVVRCDVVGDQGRELVVKLLTSEDLEQCDGLVSLDFSLPKLEFGVQARCFSLGGATVSCVVPPPFASRELAG